MDRLKTLGADLGAGVRSVAAPRFSADGNAYAYMYVQLLSDAYVVRGLE